MDDNLPALQATIHATTSSDLPAVLHALNTHYLATDFTADDTRPLTDLQPGHTYVTRAGADTTEHLATALATTAPNTAFELSNDPHETQHGTYIAYHPDTGLFRAQCNADGTPLIPAEEIRHALTQAPDDMPVRTWLALYAPALLGTDLRDALARYRTRPRIFPTGADDHPGHGQTAHCGACGTPITWYYDDPDAGTPYGHWFDPEDRDLCPATDEDADDPGHTPAPAPADFHQAALYLPPDPAARNESFPVLALAGLRIAAYLDDTYTLHLGVLTEDAHPALRTTPDGHLAVELGVDSRTLHTPAPEPRPGESGDPEWTVTGVRWNDALAALRIAAEDPEISQALATLLPERPGGASFTPEGLTQQINEAQRDTTNFTRLANERDQRTPRPGTRFPADLLPAVPADRWNAEKVSDTTIDADGQLATTVYTLAAPTAGEAERRLLAWISHDHPDDLNGATATATRPSQPGHYTVYLTQPIRY
ncbi:DUF3145 family protein [Streptomyces sp. NPDC001165]|uniref:DUF3145 family protein n=1 Tax=Streptomyces sp. NPDC001165 TaxID=3364546 RepID=UPI003692BF85